MNADWILVTPPTEEPLSLIEAKGHIVVSHDDDDDVIEGYIRAARQAAEDYRQAALFTQTWKLQLPAFADVMYLPMAAPLQSVTSVEYYDATTGTLTVLATSYYDTDTTSTPGRVVRKPDQSWPSIQSDRQVGVIITYVCGYADLALIPDSVKQGMRVYLAGLDADRTDPSASIKAAEAMWSQAGIVRWIPPSYWYVSSCLA
jgi:uncharacterized phiE125 gp8 family phage protein